MLFCLQLCAEEPAAETEKESKRPPVTLGVKSDTDPKPATPPTTPEKPAAPPSPEAPFSDARMGIAFTLPAGYTKLSEEEYRANVTRLSEHMGKEIAERIQRQAPLCFRGPSPDGRIAPSLSFSIYGGTMRYETSKIDDYREQIRAGLERGKVRHGTLDLKIVRAGDVDALRVDYEMQSQEDNTRQRQITLLIPAADRICDVGFTYFKGQQEGVEAALDKITSTFRFVQASPSGGRNWTRIFLWTGGAFVFGVVLNFVLRKLFSGSAASQKA